MTKKSFALDAMKTIASRGNKGVLQDRTGWSGHVGLSFVLFHFLLLVWVRVTCQSRFT